MLNWVRIDVPMKMGATPRGADKKLSVNNYCKAKPFWSPCSAVCVVFCTPVQLSVLRLRPVDSPSRS